MTMLSRNDQSGRSMVEMLGVLAIIGVLSVGGISGYSKAMAKFKLTKAQDQISMLLMNIRTAYATSPSYSGLSSTAAADYNLAPNDMVQSTTAGGSSYTLKGAFGGDVVVSAISEAETYFYITMNSLGREACRSLLSSDWGADGLIRIEAGSGTNGVGGAIDKSKVVCDDASSNAAKGAGVWCTSSLPVSYADAATVCSSEQSYISWVYY